MLQAGIPLLTSHKYFLIDIQQQLDYHSISSNIYKNIFAIESSYPSFDKITLCLWSRSVNGRVCVQRQVMSDKQSTPHYFLGLVHLFPELCWLRKPIPRCCISVLSSQICLHSVVPMLSHHYGYYCTLYLPSSQHRTLYFSRLSSAL